MVEKLEGTGRVYTPSQDEDSSGVRENPWTAHLRSLDGIPERRPVYEAMVARVGSRVLSRFERLERADHAAVFAAATTRLGLEPSPAPLNEARIVHAVACEATAVDHRRWVAEIDADPAQIAQDLARARRRAAALSGREGAVFAAVCALDYVASGEEVGKVVLRAAVAFQMRWNTAHQNVSRAWRKICEGSELGAWCGSFRAGHRFVCAPPSLALWEVASAYMDACSGRHRGDEPPGEDARRSPAQPSVEPVESFEDWLRAHESHNAWFAEWKRQSSRATRRWKELGAALDASGVRPGALHGQLVHGCAALGIDRWVIPAKLGQQTWRELLEPANRPSAAARAAWLPFLREAGLGREVEDAFRELERDAALADVAGVELEHAYRRLLLAAGRQSDTTLKARDAFRALIDAGERR
jgi:hypothetical protein